MNKKLVLLAVLLVIALAAFGQRTYTQKVVAGDPAQNIFDIVTNTSTATSPNYIIEADIVETPGEILTTAVGNPDGKISVPVGSLRINRLSTHVVTVLQLATFPTPYVVGQTMQITVKYIPNNQVSSWTKAIPAGTAGIIDLATPQTVPPLAPAGFNLNVTSTPAGAPIFKDAVDTGFVTPHTFFPGEAGTYTLGTMAGYNPYTPASHIVPALTAETTIDFQATEVTTYLYKLYVNGPDGKAVTGPVAGTTDYVAENADQNLLLGSYTIGAADPGYQWTVNPIVVDDTGWNLVPPLKGMGARNNGAKVLMTYEKTIEFVQTLIPTTTYTLNVNGPDGYAVTGPVAGTTDYIATDNDDMINELTGDYLIAAPPAGWAWAVNPITVSEVDFVANVATINFVLNEIPVVVTPADETQMPAGYPTTNPAAAFYIVTGAGVHDLFIPRTPTDTEAWAWYNGMWNAPTGTPDWTWLGVDFSAKAPVPVVILGPTLPVELSSFSAILTAQNFVKLTWVTESETNMNGYNVYRNETADYAAATHIGYQASTNSSTQHVYSHTDNEVETNNTYYYWLECVDFNGTSTLYGPQYVTVVGNDTPNLPTATALKNAYPNPFKASTTIAVDVKEGENATVTIYNILGQAVMTYRVPAGTHNLNWNGRDSKGNACGSGIYFYKLTSPTMNQTKKMVIVK